MKIHFYDVWKLFCGIIILSFIWFVELDIGQVAYLFYFCSGAGGTALIMDFILEVIDISRWDKR